MHLSLFFSSRIHLLLIVLLLVTNIAKAVEITNIYQVDIQVKEQSNSARWKASLEGLKVVLVRRSGSQRILNSTETSNAYKKVTSYLQKFEYSRITEITDDYKYIISLYYEPRLIDDLIKQANQPLWDNNRPVSILWLAHEEVDQDSSLYRRIIIENENEMIINDLITKNSNRRGVPVILPLMDLDDTLLVSQSDVWGRFPEAIIEASNRYSVDSIIIGKIYQRSGLWFGQFTYFNQAKNFSFEHQSNNVEDIYKQMFDSLAEVLCDQYCVTQTLSKRQELLIEIRNITNFETFQRIKNYLSEMSAVQHVGIIHIKQDKLLLQLSLLSNERTVIDSLGLNRRLKLVEQKLISTVIGGNSLEIKDDGMTLHQRDVSVGFLEDDRDTTDILKIKTIFYRWVD